MESSPLHGYWTIIEAEGTKSRKHPYVLLQFVEDTCLINNNGKDKTYYADWRCL